MATKDAAVTWINISGALLSALSMLIFYLFAQDKVASLRWSCVTLFGKSRKM